MGSPESIIDVPDVSGFAIDASVVIDYAKTDMSIMTLVSRHIAPIHLALPTLMEIEQLSAQTATRHGLDIVEPSFQQTMEAIGRKGRTSFQDRLCAILARDNEWVCITSDRNLRNHCTELGVECAWGLEPMRWLVGRRRLTVLRARAIANRIAQVNPFITADIVARFEAQFGP